MADLPKVSELPADEFQRHQSRMAAQVGVEAVERQLFGNKVEPDAVDISLWVNGRELRMRTMPATVHRIIAILTGLPE
jgi:hypothetical protein